MSCTISPSSNQPYGVAMVLETLEIPRSTYYAFRKRQRQPERVLAKRGPKTDYSDADLTGLIRQVLAESVFVGEGYRKVWARLRFKGVRTSKARVLRLMRESALLSPVRAMRVLGPRSHDGSITTTLPDQMWGTDATYTLTTEEGAATVFVAVDHCTAECVGIHAAKVGDRFEALEPIRQAIKARFGSYRANVAASLKLRHDHGSQYMSHHFQGELHFLGVESSPAFVRSPEGNGCSERFIRTLKEQLLWVRTFRTVEELRLALHDWVRTYNDQWLIGRHCHRTPRQVREALLAHQSAA